MLFWGSESEVKRSGADAQVVLLSGLSSLSSFVEHLTIFYISGLALASSSILRVLDLDLAASERAKRYVS